jgi:hypothetical protein
MALILFGISAVNAQGQLPKDWTKSGVSSDDYDISIDRDVKHAGKASCTVKSKADAPKGSGVLVQLFRADDYRGKRLKVTAHVKSKDVEGWGGLWVRVDGKDQTGLAFDNMMDRPIKGTLDWKEYEIVLDVPDKAEEIFFGFILVGKGQAWVDDFKVSAVGNDVKTTGKELRPMDRKWDLRKDLPKAPRNLDFEQ